MSIECNECGDWFIQDNTETICKVCNQYNIDEYYSEPATIADLIIIVGLWACIAIAVYFGIKGI
jgi:hypothetical protein